MSWQIGQDAQCGQALPIGASHAKSRQVTCHLPDVLSCLIKESQHFGGTILDQFWEQVRKCHLKLKENGVSVFFWSDILVKLTCPVDRLRRNPLAVPSNLSSTVLFQGIDRNDVDFTPVFDMGAEYFTHLGIACKCPNHPCTETLTHDTTVVMNPGRPKSGSITPHSVSDIVNIETGELLAVAEGVGFGEQNQAALSSLVRS